MDRQVIEYLPPVLRPVRELRAACAGQQTALEQVWAAVENALDDQFIGEATDRGIARREKILGISPKGTDTLEERRFRVKARLNEQLPYTLEVLERQLVGLCGPDGYSMTLGNYLLTVRVALTASSNFGDVYDLLRRVTPANIVVDLSLMYCQHGALTGYTHGQLAAYTHNQIKSEVFT